MFDSLFVNMQRAYVYLKEKTSKFKQLYLWYHIGCFKEICSLRCV